LAQNAIKERL